MCEANLTSQLQLTFRTVPRSEPSPATRFGLETNPHLIGRRGDIAWFLITAKRYWILSIPNNVKIVKSLPTSADQNILVSARWCSGNVKEWVKMNVHPETRVHTNAPYAGLNRTVALWIARWFYGTMLSCRLIDLTSTFTWWETGNKRCLSKVVMTQSCHSHYLQ